MHYICIYFICSYWIASLYDKVQMTFSFFTRFLFYVMPKMFENALKISSFWEVYLENIIKVKE